MKLAENLKKAVLQAAMQGKLTRQLKTDSSVDDLLQKIAEEKARLIKEGKMSKSAGNGVDPIDVINKYGTDSLRYFLATSSTPGQDMKYDEEKVNASSNYLNKIWNSARYILMNIDPNYIYDENIKTKELNLIDRYILAKLNKTIKEVTKYMDNYNYGIASNILFNFVYDDFCLFLECSTRRNKRSGKVTHFRFENRR